MSNYRKKVLESRKQILQLTLDQEKQIIEIYSKQASKLIDEILEMPESRTRTHKIDTTRIINEYVKELYENLNDNILKNTWESSYIQRKVILNFVDTVAPNRVVNEGLKRSITNISDNTVRTLIAGGYYSDGKTLSNRLWNYTKQNGQDIDTIIKMNVAGGANVRTLASELEKYVNPKNRIESKSFKAGLNSYKISFNAQRLARTSITHAATETQIQNAKKNPFSLGLKWNLSASHSARMHGRQDECDSREGKVYEPDKVNLQHPNCLCYFTEEVDEKKALTDIKAWASGDLENKQMDEWFNDFKEKWNGPNNIENKEPIRVKVNDVKISIPDKKKESKVSTWHKYKADDKQYSSKKAIKEHLSKEYKMEFSDSRKYPINKDILQGSINWLDKFHGYFKGFKEIDPVKLPSMKIKSGISPVGYYSYYQKHPEAVELVLNGKYFCDKEFNTKYIAQCIQSKWTVQNAKSYKTFVHEYGHHVADSLKWLENNELDSDKWCKNFINDVLLEYNKKYNKECSFKDISDLVSRYGGTKAAETFAETFAEYFGGDSPREFAKVFGAKVEEKLKYFIKAKE